ncbi:ABC transporter ATP-binding protein [Streptococcus sp. DD11]|uniref:ABC transporter ATP-binding protein n=1 Tax=Streptococcus sp. DD11 TaxID=1777879 RepID=UPI000B168833|nr:ABC transporter ATP-binding protein [Streptococcus sp. DD11]
MDVRHDVLDDQPLIAADSLAFSYDNSRAESLQIGDLQIAAGEFLVLCGPSGSGKSSFLRLLNGLIPDYYHGQLRGRLRVDSLEAGQKPAEEFSSSVASVFQNPASQFFHKIVKHELVLPCENQGKPAEQILQQLEQLTAEFSLSGYLEREMLSLSGGEKQRMALLTAMMQDTPILVLDEPTANLDRGGIEQVASHLADLKAKGKTIIVAEHRLDYLQDLADRYLYFDQGRLLTDYGREDFLALSDQERHERSLRSLHLPAYPAAAEKTGPALPFPEESLSVKNLRLKAGNQDLASIEEAVFGRGQITALVGPNGAGKSTLAAYLAGLLDDKEAVFSFKGQALSALQRLQQTALVMQEVRLQLFADSVEKELLLGIKEAVDADALLARLDLQDLKDRHPMTLSGGEQQRLVIASQLLTQKDIFIFDEPSSGLDYLQMQHVAGLLQELKKQGKVVVLISHDEELLELTADRLFHLGK